MLNRGISGDTTVGVMRRIAKSTAGLDVDKLFLMIGLNDLMYRDDKEIVSNIGDILMRLDAQEKFLQSILPVDKSRKEHNNRIMIINEGLKKLCKENGYRYIDLHAHFRDAHGGLLSRLSRDGVHLNAAGYKLWSDVLRPYLY